jgi:5-methylcytosine-specific restriction endonuclease McrA
MPARKLTVRPSYIQAPTDQLLFDFESKDVKQCQRCGQWLPLDSFYRMAKGRMGRQADCKRCRVDRYGKPGQMERLVRKEQGLKVCHGCNRELPIEAFGRFAHDRPTIRPRCRECRNAEHRAAYAADPETFRAKSRESDRRYKEWRKAYCKERYQAKKEYINAQNRAYSLAHPEVNRAKQHRRKARKQKASIVSFTHDQLLQKLAFWGHRCWICGGEAGTIDHVKPLNKGGPHILANLRPACKSCNSSKCDTWPLPPSRLLKQYS